MLNIFFILQLEHVTVIDVGDSVIWITEEEKSKCKESHILVNGKKALKLGRNGHVVAIRDKCCAILLDYNVDDNNTIHTTGINDKLYGQ